MDCFDPVVLGDKRSCLYPAGAAFRFRRRHGLPRRPYILDNICSCKLWLFANICRNCFNAPAGQLSEPLYSLVYGGHYFFSAPDSPVVRSSRLMGQPGILQIISVNRISLGESRLLPVSESLSSSICRCRRCVWPLFFNRSGKCSLVRSYFPKIQEGIYFGGRRYFNYSRCLILRSKQIKTDRCNFEKCARNRSFHCPGQHRSGDKMERQFSEGNNRYLSASFFTEYAGGRRLDSLAGNRPAF